jgi:hypothetical protein
MDGERSPSPSAIPSRSAIWFGHFSIQESSSAIFHLLQGRAITASRVRYFDDLNLIFPFKANPKDYRQSNLA